MVGCEKKMVLVGHDDGIGACREDAAANPVISAVYFAKRSVTKSLIGVAAC